MPKKVITPEQILAKLRQIEVTVAQGKTVPVACREDEISDVSYYRWRRKSAVGEIGNKEVRGDGLQNHV